MDSMAASNFIASVQSDGSASIRPQAEPRLIPANMRMEMAVVVDIGRNTEVSAEQAMNMVYERSLAKLQSVVAEARAELGIPDDAVLDTSPEATAARIVDFALGLFDRWLANHPEYGEDEGRRAFSDFIGNAIGQGIEEARGILTALNALTPEVGGNVDTIASLVQQRLDDFAANK